MLFAEVSVLVLHVRLDVLLCVLLQRCFPMQDARALSVLHRDLWITIAIDNTNGILVGLRTVLYKAFEVWLLQAIFSHEFVEFPPHNILDNHIL
jgi:hypothetical protein